MVGGGAGAGGGNSGAVDVFFYFTHFNSERDLIFDAFVTRTIEPDEWK